MKKHSIISILFLGAIFAQKLPYGKPNYFQIVQNKKDLKQITLKTPFDFPQELFDDVQPVKFDIYDHYYLKINLDNNSSTHFKFIRNHFSDEMKLYFIDLDTKGWVGPYSKNILKNNPEPISGGMNTKNILIEISIPSGEDLLCPIQTIISPEKRPENFQDTVPTYKKKALPAPYKVGNKGTSRSMPSQRDHLKRILLTGYWPPSNECIRPFSTNETLNPNGWIGDNWEERGYDIHSFFPTFDPPDCENCGQGEGDLEVDYQDTSEDWWNIVDSIQPIAIITFSRGGIDYRWELEWMTTNWAEDQWIEDFEEPLLPTPSPPDSTYPQNTARYSSLPMDSIEAAMNVSGLSIFPVIDYTYGTGNYLSEFMGYHGVWYKAIMDSLNNLNNACYMAGHIHIGGLADWGEAHEAVKITLREVIEVLNDSVPIIGDINNDGLISILDLYFIISYLMGEIDLDDNGLIIADINYDLSVDVFDILQIANILMDS